MCGECGNQHEKDLDEDWTKCRGCKQWYHFECLDLSASAAEDRYFVFDSCPKCEGIQALVNAANDDSDVQSENESDENSESDESDNEDDESED